MKRHALFFATALAVASLGGAGLAVAQSAPSASAPDTDGAASSARAMKGERMKRDGARRTGHHGGHAMHGGIERMDSDGDGRVSRAEFDAAKAAREQARGEARAARGGAMVRHMAFDFDAIDADRDGYIVRSEVMAHRDRMREQMRAEHGKRFAEAFAAADLDGDGRLSRAEVDAKMPHLSKRFAWLDDNRDGFLGRDELEAGRGR